VERQPILILLRHCVRVKHLEAIRLRKKRDLPTGSFGTKMEVPIGLNERSTSMIRDSTLTTDIDCVQPPSLRQHRSCPKTPFAQKPIITAPRKSLIDACPKLERSLPKKKRCLWAGEDTFATYQPRWRNFITFCRSEPTAPIAISFLASTPAPGSCFRQRRSQPAEVPAWSPLNG
jgi:hypothetical protein